MSCPVDLEVDEAMFAYKKNKLQAIYKGSMDYVVKIICSSEAGNPSSRCIFNGFFYGEGNLILSSSRIANFNGADKYEALFFEGDGQLPKCCRLTLLMVGALVRQETTAENVTYAVHRPDVAVFECPSNDVPPHRPRPYGEQVHLGSSVCFIGYKAVDEPQLSISEGIVSYTSLDTMRITAHADDEFSGSPVFSTQGYVAGMIGGRVGSSINQVEVVDVTTLHLFLTLNGLPGFNG